MRWEHDNTDSADDVASFQAILATLNLRRAEEMLLSAANSPLALMIQNRITSAFQAAVASPGKSIMFIHYAGHGALREGELFISEGGTGNELNLSILINQTANAHWFPGNNMDIVWILDCCYAHGGTRPPNTQGRIVEIIAATDATQPIARYPPENTLTRKLRSEIAKRKRDGHQFLEIADVMQTIRANSINVHPSNFLKLGVSSVRLPFSGVRSIDPHNTAPSLRAVWSVKTLENMTREQFEAFLNWVRTLPPGFDLEILGLYEGNSSLLILQSAWSVYSKLAGLPGISLVGEVRSPNRLWSLGQQGQRQPQPPQVSPSKKENVPFRRSPKP